MRLILLFSKTKSLNILIASMLSFFVLNTQAQTTYMSFSTGDWNSPASWIPAVPPSPGNVNDVIILFGSANLTLSADITQNQVIVNLGSIDGGGFDVTLGNNLNNVGSISNVNNMDLTGDACDNNGSITVTNTLTTTCNTLKNEGNLLVNAFDFDDLTLDNRGFMQVTNDMVGDGEIENESTLNVKNLDYTALGAEFFDNKKGGVLTISNNFTMAGTLINRSEAVINAKNITVDGTSSISLQNEGCVYVTASFNNVDEMVLNQWKITCANYTNGGTTTGGGYIRVDNGGTFNNLITGTVNGNLDVCSNDESTNPYTGSGTLGGSVVFCGETMPASCKPAVTNEWTGAMSVDWNNANNWSQTAVPQIGVDNVKIPDVSGSGGFTCTVTGLVYAEDLDVEAGGLLTVSSTGTIQVRGDITASSTATMSIDGNILMNGSAVQNIDGNVDFASLEIANSNGVTINTGTSNVETALILTSGALTIDPAADLVLKSNASQTAYLDDFTTGSAVSIVGDITVERFIDNPGNGYHYLGAPISAANIADWATDYNISVQNGADGSQVTPTADCQNLLSSSPFGSLFDYRESAVVNCDLEGWHVRSSGTINAGQGFAGMIPNSTVVDQKGSVNTGIVTATGLTNTNAVGDGNNLLANPYPSPIDWAAFQASNSGSIDGVAMLWNTSGDYAGSYVPVTTMDAPATRMIGSSQAFFVRVSNLGSTNVQFTNAHRVTGNANFYKTDQYSSYLKIDASGNGFKSQARVYFNEDATDQFDNQFDAKFKEPKQGQPALFSINAGKELVVNTLANLEDEKVVNLGFKCGTDGQFSLDFSMLETFSSTGLVLLEDHQLNKVVDLRTTNTYTFQATVNDDEGRFSLRFVPGITFQLTDAGCAGNDGQIDLNQNSTIDWTYDLRLDGQSVQNGIFSGTKSILALEEGSYELVLTDVSGYQAIENIQIAAKQKVIADFVSSQTWVYEGDAVEFENLSDGATAISWDFGNGNVIQGIENPTFTYTEEGLYVVRMIASNSECQDVKEQTIEVQANKSTALETPEEELIKIYNQQHQISIALKNTDINQLNMYNLTGKLLTAQNVFDSNERLTVNTTEFAHGYYILELVGEYIRITEKILVN